mmetsp:Transcript_10264/g.25781  ORF Transcript_10264/g.25781 Transcript_10264/m.25781 type:complete len:317 (-) Transcript_10264:122-1072(-)
MVLFLHTRVVPKESCFVVALSIEFARGNGTVDRTVHAQEAVAIRGSRTDIVRWGIGVIQAISLVLIIEVLVRVGEPVTVAQLVAHGVQALVIVGIEQIILVHFGNTRCDDPARLQFHHFVDTEPSRFIVVSVANLHDSILMRAHVLNLNSFAGQFQDLDVTPFVPVLDGLDVFVRPRFVQGVPQFQLESSVSPGKSIPQIRSIVSHVRILVPQLGRKTRKVLEGSRQITEAFLEVVGEALSDFRELLEVGLAHKEPGGVSSRRDECQRHEGADKPANAASFSIAFRHDGYVFVVVVVVGLRCTSIRDSMESMICLV